MADEKSDDANISDTETTEEHVSSDETIESDADTESVMDDEPIAEETTEDTYEAVPEHYEEAEERGTSFAAKALTWLLLLLAGAGAALWGAPKLAPQLPEWAAPAAKYLTPGGDAALKDVAALRTEVTERFDAAPVAPTQDEIAALIKTETEAVQQAVQADADAKFAALEEKLAAKDATGLESRIATVESQLEGLSTEVSSLTDSVQTALAQGGNVSEETLAEISTKSAEVDGLRAQVGEISTQVGELTQRIEDNENAAQAQLAEVKAEAEQAQQEAEQMAAMAAYQEALEELTESVESGSPFATELEKFSNVADQEIPAPLLDNATTGIVSLASLRGDFAELSHEAIRASIKAEAAESGNSASRFGAFLKSQVASRSLTATEGDGTDAVLSRVEAALVNGDLSKVTEEASTLSEDARAPLSDWLGAIEARKSVLDSLAAFASQPS